MFSNAKQRVFNLSITGLLAIVLMLVAAGLAMTPGKVAADPGDPPGNDGVCKHGNSGRLCREDPQPDHGKDCAPHGANTDGNEDHCFTEVLNEPPVTSSPPPSTSTTEDEPEDQTEDVLQIEQGSTSSPAAQEVAEVLGAEDVPEVVALPFAGSRGEVSNGTDSWLAMTVLGALVAVGGVGTAVWRKRGLN